MKYRQPALEKYSKKRYTVGYLPAQIHPSNYSIWISKRDLARAVTNNHFPKSDKKGIS